MVAAAWFGVDAVPGEVWLGRLYASRLRRFAVASLERGLLVGVPEREVGAFLEAAVDAGWRVRRVEPEFPPCSLLLPRLPATHPLKPPAGLVLYRVSGHKYYLRLVEAYGGLPSAYEPYASSALLYGSAFKGYAVSFTGGSRGLAGRFRRLEPPLLARLAWLNPLYTLTPLDVETLAKGLASSSYTEESRACSVEVELAPGLSLRLREGSDNSLAIVGAPGTGKSSFLDYLLSRLEGWRVLVLDVTGEHRVLEGYGYEVVEAGVDFFINPLAVGVEAAYSVVSGVIEAVWGERLTPITSYTLYTVLQRSRTLLEAYREVDRLLRSSEREDERSAAAALLRRLRPLLHPALLGHGGLPLGRVVVDMSGLPEEVKTTFTLAALHLAYSSAVRGLWSGLVVVDEADRLGDTEVANRIADELRKYGVSLWAVGHSLQRIARRLADAATLLVFATNDPGNLERLAAVVGWRAAEALGRLGYGQALVLRRGSQPLTTSLHIPVELRARGVGGNPCLSFEDAARRHAADPLELMQLYVELLPARSSLPRILRGERVPEEDFKLFRLKAGKAPRSLLEALAEIYACLEGRSHARHSTPQATQPLQHSQP